MEKFGNIQTKHFMLAELIAMHLQPKLGSSEAFSRLHFLPQTKWLIKKM